MKIIKKKTLFDSAVKAQHIITIEANKEELATTKEAEEIIRKIRQMIKSRYPSWFKSDFTELTIECNKNINVTITEGMCG
jgi:endonuclease/exonuclease/phosphatase (EEP) superfamily protein YafD